MKKLLALLAIVLAAAFSAQAQTVTAYGPGHDGYKLGSDSLRNLYITNSYGVVIASAEALKMNSEEIVKEIQSSSVPDKALIVRVLAMHKEPGKTQEIINMTRTYNEVAVIVIRHLDARLKKKFSKRKLKALKEKKS